MESKTSKDLEARYKDFSKKNSFTYYDSEPLEAPKDSKLLFNISGGVKYQDELLGLKKSINDKTSSIQRCIRTDGMKSIGNSGRHHLFFQMLGHFMFYCTKEKECKEEFIKFAYEFLIKELGLDKDRIYTTVHPEDKVSIDIWRKLGNNNIILNTKNTFVSPYADKSALRTEILFKKSDDSLVELWNLVFTQFNSKNIFENPSEYIAADSGASLERIVSAIENVNNNYDNSMWINFIKYLQEHGNSNEINTYRRLADFYNTSVMMIDEGIKPGNKVQPYMLRKMLRTMFDICDDLDIAVELILDEYIKYATLNTDKIEICKIIKEELERYYKTIQNAIKEARKKIARQGIDNVDIENLKSSLGLSDKYINKLLENKPIELRYIYK